MEIKILGVTAVKATKNGKQYTGIKYGDNQWVNVWGDHTDKKNRTMTISEIQVFGKSGWAKEEKPVQQPEVSQPSSSSDKLTKGGYKNWLEEMWELAMKLEPDLEPTEKHSLCDRSDARVALVNTAMIAWSNNKIIDEFSAEDEEPPE